MVHHSTKDLDQTYNAYYSIERVQRNLTQRITELRDFSYYRQHLSSLNLDTLDLVVLHVIY